MFASISHENHGLYDKGFTRYIYLDLSFSIPTQEHLLTPLGNKPFENTVGKGEIARNEQFLLFSLCFLPVWITFCIFRQI